MPDTGLTLEERVARLEDESEITRLLMSYGPSADAGLADLAGSFWLEDGTYDWDANGTPHLGSEGVATMLRTPGHRDLMAEGVAHFAGPLLITVDGEHASALNYSIIMRREDRRFYVWRVSAVRWDVERHDGRWRIRRRTNRLMDATGAGLGLLGSALAELYPDADR